MRRMRPWGIIVIAAALGRSAASQDHAFMGIMAVFPSGGAAGTTVDEDLRPRYRGVVDVTVSGQGITASLLRAKEESIEYDWQPDRGYPIFQNKCGACHALPNPIVLRHTLQEWQAVIERMVTKNGAPVGLAGEMSEGNLIAKYLGKATQQATGVRARLVIAPDAPPGRREIRVVGKDWTSQAGTFEVTRDRELLEVGTNTVPEKAQALPIPATVSGQLNEAREVDYYTMELRRGQRITLRAASFSGNDAHFFPRLRVLDAAGRTVATNAGHDGFVALIDFTAPADGKVRVAIDDLFSRGSAVMVYRLKVAEAAYDAALFPAGLRRGTSVRAELVGENAQGSPVELSGDAPGLHRVATPRGEFPYIVGEFPEIVRAPGDPAPRVTLPASLNGRNASPGQSDLYLLEVAPEDAGKPFSVEVFGGRIGSPLEAKVVLVEGDRVRQDRTPLVHSEARPIPYSGKFDPNWPAYKVGAQLYGRDERFDVDFPRPGTYALEISDAGGRYGPGYVYRVQVGPSEPDFSVAITPDNPCVHPGSSIYLELHALRRNRVDAPIEVRIPDLPAGITASLGVLRPGQGRSFLVLTAAPDAKPGLALRTRPVATAEVGGRKLVRSVLPYEFRDHCRPTLLRDELVVTVDSRPSWRAELEAASPTLAPGKPVEIKVKLDRRGPKDGDVPFFIFADHPAVRFSGLPAVAAGASESTVTATLSKNAGPVDRIRIVVVNGLNEWIGATSGAMNRSSAALELAVAP